MDGELFKLMDGWTRRWLYGYYKADKSQCVEMMSYIRLRGLHYVVMSEGSRIRDACHRRYDDVTI